MTLFRIISPVHFSALQQLACPALPTCDAAADRASPPHPPNHLPTLAAPAVRAVPCRYDLQNARDVYRLACGPEGMNKRLVERYLEVRGHFTVAPVRLMRWNLIALAHLFMGCCICWVPPPDAVLSGGLRVICGGVERWVGGWVGVGRGGAVMPRPCRSLLPWRGGI